jgi:hypothetical protein
MTDNVAEAETAEKSEPEFVIPVTIQRLWMLKPGEVMTFYRGNLQQDVSRSEDAYRRMLDQINLSIADLEGTGRIKVSCHEVKREKLLCPDNLLVRWTEYEYQAVGVAPQ